jgi:hypothetical protein
VYLGKAPSCSADNPRSMPGSSRNSLSSMDPSHAASTCPARSTNRAPTEDITHWPSTAGCRESRRLFKIEMRGGDGPRAYLANHVLHLLARDRRRPRPAPVAAATAETRIPAKQTARGEFKQRKRGKDGWKGWRKWPAKD